MDRRHRRLLIDNLQTTNNKLDNYAQNFATSASLTQTSKKPLQYSGQKSKRLASDFYWCYNTTFKATLLDYQVAMQQLTDVYLITVKIFYLACIAALMSEFRNFKNNIYGSMEYHRSDVSFTFQQLSVVLLQCSVVFVTMVIANNLSSTPTIPV